MGHLINEKKHRSLVKSAVHLNIALAELNKIAGSSSSHMSSLADLKELVKVKLLLDKVTGKVTKGMAIQSGKAQNMVITKQELDKWLLAMLGKESYVDLWWTNPNKAFDMKTPIEVYRTNPDAIARYLGTHISGEYS